MNQLATKTVKLVQVLKQHFQAEQKPMTAIMEAQPKLDEPKPDGPGRYMIWIDGVGTYLLCLNDRVTVGRTNLPSSSSDGNEADIALLANLSRRHCSIIRSGEGYLLEAHGPTKVGNRDVNDRVHLNDGYEIELANSVKLRFCLPTALSVSARLEFVSDHRPSHTVDGVILMDDTCLLGPGNENHVRCPDWPGSVLLIQKDGHIWCKSRLDVFVGDQHVKDGVALETGDIVTGPEFRFRIEAAVENNGNTFG